MQHAGDQLEVVGAAAVGRGAGVQRATFGRAQRALDALLRERVEQHVELHRAAVLGDRIVVVVAGDDEPRAVVELRADSQAFPLFG